MAVITISRELGSGGGYLTMMVQNTLRYKLADKQLIEQALIRYGKTTRETLDQSNFSIWSHMDLKTDELSQMLHQTILAFGKHDQTIILGRGGYLALKGYQNVLNVFLWAPMEYRARMLLADEAQRFHNIAQAEEMVRKSDKSRVNFLQTYYDVQVEAIQNFNLTVDASQIPLHMAAGWIVEACWHLDEIRGKLTHTTENIEIDPELDAIVSEILASQK